MRKQIGLKLETETVSAVDRAAESLGLTRTEAVEAALAAWLAKPSAPRPQTFGAEPSAKQAAFRKATADLPIGAARPAPGAMLKGAGGRKR